MTVFLVWDKFNGSQEHAQRINADDAEDAAITYAQDDCDGRSDGIYAGHGGMPQDPKYGAPIMVDDAGTIREFTVSIVEYEAHFGACEAKP